MASLRSHGRVVLTAVLAATAAAVQLVADVEVGNGDHSDVGAEFAIQDDAGKQSGMNLSMLSTHDRLQRLQWARFSGDDCVKQTRADQAQCIPCKKNLTDGTQA